MTLTTTTTEPAPSSQLATSALPSFDQLTAPTTLVYSGDYFSDSDSITSEQSLDHNVFQYLYVMNNDCKLPPVHHSLYTGRPNLNPLRSFTTSHSTHTRSLTLSTTSSDSSASSSDSEMATEAISPGTPPELSGSWSSKSSTTRSSNHACDGLEDAGNYEDIGLSDPRQLAPEPLRERSNNSRKLLRSSTAPIAIPTPHSKSLPNSPTNLKPTTTGLRSAAAMNSGMRSLSGPRSTTANSFLASTPSLAVPSRQSRRQPPPHANLHSSRPHGAPHRSATSPALPRIKPEVGPFLPLKKTVPAQATRRKSAKEIEREFDALNESDDDLPEDAVMTNIPISPNHTTVRSASVSPERGSISPQSPIPPDFGRARSWDFALSRLNAEMRDLTLKLEGHKESNSRRNSQESQPRSPMSSSPPRPSLNHSKSTTFAMPPLQRPNPLVDPLPYSKEKEKHLSRTRPAYLPPKSRVEEVKHLKEYKKMMDAFAKKEKRESGGSDKPRSRRTSKEKAFDDSLRAWRSILGDWNGAVNKPTTRELWWSGVPPALRGQVWARAIGNDLQLSVASYKAALARAKATLNRISQPPAPPSRSPHTRQASLSESKGDVRARRSLAAMEKDIATAFPHLGLFQKDQMRHEALKDLLLAYSSYREDTGHVRGTAGIAALLLLQHMPASTSSSAICDNHDGQGRRPSADEREREAATAATAGAFIALANLLNRPLSLAFCINDAAAKERTIQHVEKAIKVKSPRLHEHFSALMSRCPGSRTSSPAARGQAQGDATPILRDIVNPLAQSLLTSVLTAAEAARVFDILVFEGDGVVVRAIVGILGRCEGSLYGSQEEINKCLGWQSSGAPISRGEDDLMNWVKWAGREDMPAPR